MKFELKKEYLKYLYATLALFFLLLTKNVVVIFEFLYGIANYGLFNEVFKNALSCAYVIIGIILILFIFKPKFYKENEMKNLPIKRIFILYALTLTPIVLISWKLGWELKVLYDFGKNLTGGAMYAQIAYLAYTVPKMLAVTLIIHFSHIFLENSIVLKNDNMKKYIPFGGIILLFTFGLFELIFNYHELSLVYFFFSIYFGIIYLLTDKSIVKSYFLILILYLL